MGRTWQGVGMEETTPSCSVAEVTLAKLGELSSPKAEVLGVAGAISTQADGWFRVSFSQ